jgi:hypothetical protein
MMDFITTCRLSLTVFVVLLPTLAAADVPLESIQSLSQSISDKVVAWRRDFHQHPEL